MHDPVVTADGMTYERDAITRWLQSSLNSPLTGQKLDHTRLTPNVALRGMIRELLEANPHLDEERRRREAELARRAARPQEGGCSVM